MNRRHWAGAEKRATVLIGAVVVIATSLTSLLMPERGGPDERHHIAHISNVAASNPSIFLDYENVFTDLDQLNHLIHPPAYYVLVGTVVRAVIPVSSALKDFYLDSTVETYSLTTSEIYFNLRSQVLKVARFVSVILMIWTIWLASRLVSVITKFGNNRSPLGALFLLITLANPTAILITSVANNDALVLPITFLLALPLTRLALDQQKPKIQSCIQLFGIAIPLAILTKATLWPLALGSGLLGLAILASKDGERTRKLGQGSPLKRVQGTTNLFGLFLSITLWAWAIIYLIAQKRQYGSFQPTYGEVYGQTTPGKFEAVPPLEPNFLDFLARSTNAGYRSLAGFMGQHERILEPLNFVVVATWLLLLSIGVILLFKLKSRPHMALGASIFALPLFLSFWVITGWNGFKSTGYYTSQGRYFLPYLIFTVIGMSTLISTESHLFRSRTSSLSSKFWRLLGLAVLMAVAFQVASPFKYIANTTSFSSIAGNEATVNEALSKTGIPVTLRAVGNEKFERLVSETGRFELAWSGSIVELHMEGDIRNAGALRNQPTNLVLLIQPSTTGTIASLKGQGEGCNFSVDINVEERGWYSYETPRSCLSMPRMVLERAPNFPNPGSITLEKAYLISL